MSQRLVECAAKGDVDTLRALLGTDVGRAAVNTPDERGWYPTTAASDAGHAAALELLLANGADADLADTDPGTEWPALAHATRGGHADAVRVLLAAGPGQSSLDVAVLQAADMTSEGAEFVDILSALLDAGGNANAAEEDERNPALYLAVEAGCMDAVRVLLDGGARPDFGRTEEGPAESGVDYMNGGWTTLLRAVMDQPEEMITLLIDRGANPNVASSAFRKTPLMQAAEWDRPEVIRLLVDRGADVNTVSPAWGTALAVACQEGNEQAVAVLLELGADAGASWEPTMGGPGSVAEAATGNAEIERLLVSAT